jgi:hypothetical protein
MIKIQTYCPRPEQVGAHLRIISPLSAMRRQDPREIDLWHKEADQDTSMHQMMLADIAIMQRPFSTMCVHTAELAKKAGVKLWIDWDDDLTAVHISNKVWKYYQRPDLQENLEKLQDMADVVTVTTPRLAEVFGKHPEKVVMLPNCIEDKLIPDKPGEPKYKAIMWRGSKSHQHDLATYRDELIRFAKEYSPQGWKFIFVGANPQLILHGMPEGSYRHMAEFDYYDLMGFMQEAAAPIHMVPLADSDFNHAKSNLAYIEAAAAGSLVIGPNWPEWDRPGISHYDEHHSLYSRLVEAVENPERSREQAQKGFDYVKKYHAMSVVNGTRWDIIEHLTS